MKFLATLIILLVLFAAFLRLIESKLVFFPSKYPNGYWKPESFGLQVEDCYFSTPDGLQLHGWFVSNNEAIATLLWCHGNAGNISDRLDNLAILARLPINVFIFDFRGYGKSEGTPTENGVYLDAQSAYDYLVARHEVDEESVVLFGRSLGGAVAVDLASKRRSAGLILESTFTSAKDMARSAFGFLPVHLIMKTELNSVDKIARIQLPVLVLHGTNDNTVPLRLGRALFDAANDPKKFIEIPGADHNDTYVVGGDGYFAHLLQLIEQAVPK